MSDTASRRQILSALGAATLAGCARGGGRETRLLNHELVLRRRQLALRLVVLRLELRSLRLHAAVGQRVETRLGGLDQRLRTGDLGLDRRLLRRRAHGVSSRPST